MSKKNISNRIEDNLEGTVVFSIPFPTGDDLSILKQMSPIVIKQNYSIDYNYSYGQDSAFYAALSNGRFIVSREPQSGYTYANPRAHDMYSGRATEWVVESMRSPPAILVRKLSCRNAHSSSFWSSSKNATLCSWDA
jgi:hypothetical protein